MHIYHNSRNLKYRSPFGAVPVNTVIKIGIDAPEADRVILRIWLGNSEKLIEMARENDGFFSGEFKVPEEPGLYWYYFIVEKNGCGRVFYGNAQDGLAGEGCQSENPPESYQITAYEPTQSPKWYKDAIVYQIFPDRFARGEDFEERKNAPRMYELYDSENRGREISGPGRFIQEDWDVRPSYDKFENGDIRNWQFYGGTLEGIVSKLSYIKSLGASAIYLNPIFMAASCHRYDTADYMQIDPLLGDEESFRTLCREADKMGISIILDGVFSHTGADSIYFDRFGNFNCDGAYNNPSSKFRKWFRFDDSKIGYECWWGVADLPNVDENEPTHLEYICGENGVIRKWLKCGAKGWRLDVADELPDSFIESIRSAVKNEGEENVLIGEVWEDASNKVSYSEQRRYFSGKELDAVMNYPFRDFSVGFVMFDVTPEQFCRKMLSLKENYPKENFYSNFNLVGSHDCVRILTQLAGCRDVPKEQQFDFYLNGEQYAFAKRRLKLLSVLQYAMPGVPVIYYGDEAGMQGHDDPYNRGGYPWGHADEDLIHHYTMLGLIYNTNEVLRNGDFDAYVPGTDVLAIERSNGAEKIITLLNRNCYDTRHVEIASGKSEYALELLSSKEIEIIDGHISVEIGPLEGLMILMKEQKPKSVKMERSAGVICSLSSIPDLNEKEDDDPDVFKAYAVLGEAGRRFVDFLSDSGMKLWQILPFNPMGLGNSPYFSPAVFAGDPRYIDYNESVDMSGFEEFCKKESYWLDDWAAWSARDNDPKKEQYIFFKQWEALHAYANSKGISIIGDIPVYVCPDGADVWAHPEEFQIDSDGHLKFRAGVPPDYFTPDGQDWGNPLYDWDKMKANGFKWWNERMRVSLERFDYVRLDHFRGFSRYYSIPDGKSALEGSWKLGPGMDLFNSLKKPEDGWNLPIIAEDLGDLDLGVYNLIKLSGFPGMNVWQFNEKDINEMTEQEMSRRVFYSGTHDNETLAGWCSQKGGDGKKEAMEIIEHLYSLSVPWVIIQIQDMLLLGNEARLNVPGTAKGNWTWRAKSNMLNGNVSKKFRELIRKYDR